MKLSYKSWLFAAVMACFGLLPAAFGQTTLHFINSNGDSYGGEQTSPYNFTINNSSSVVSLICDSTLNQISDGESWTANSYDPTDAATPGNGLWSNDPTAAAQYDEVAALAVALLGGTNIPGLSTTGTGATDVQEILSWAIWDVFINGDGPNGLGSETVAADAAVAFATNWAVNQGAAYASDVVIYTPNVCGPQQNANCTPTNGPQEFIGLVTPTPEASSAAVLGVDLLGFGGVLLFLRRRASRVA